MKRDLSNVILDVVHFVTQKQGNKARKNSEKQGRKVKHKTTRTARKKRERVKRRSERSQGERKGDTEK